MSGEMEILDFRHLKLPPLTSESLDKVITPYVQEISHDDWMSLDPNDSGSGIVALLFDMRRAVIGDISALILEDVEPRVLASAHYHDVAVQGGCSSCRVMEQDIQACFRNSLHHYFGEALDEAEESSNSLDHLVRLFSAEITKSINSSLAQITWTALSSDTYDSPTAECNLQTVHNIGKMFKYILEGRNRMTGESCDKLACPGCNSEECCCSDSHDAEHAEQGSTETLELSERSSESSACVDDLNPEPAPQFSDYAQSYHFISSSPSPPSPDYLINETFLTVVLAKLVDHIAAKTRASILNVDLSQLVCGVTKRTGGMVNFALPQSVDSLHIPIYKDLCRKFRSKYVLQAVMESGEEAFEFAVSEALISVIKKSKTSEKRWNTYKSGNLSPLPESQTPEPDSEERSQQTSPSPPERSLGRTLREKLSRWASNVVNFINSGLDSEIHRLDFTVTSPVWTNPLL